MSFQNNAPGAAAADQPAGEGPTAPVVSPVGHVTLVGAGLPLDLPDLASDHPEALLVMSGRGAGDPALETRLDRFTQTARRMFRTVEQDPRDLTASRKFLGVYLTGVNGRELRLYTVTSGTSCIQNLECVGDYLVNVRVSIYASDAKQVDFWVHCSKQHGECVIYPGIYIHND